MNSSVELRALRVPVAIGGLLWARELATTARLDSLIWLALMPLALVAGSPWIQARTRAGTRDLTVPLLAIGLDLFLDLPLAGAVGWGLLVTRSIEFSGRRPRGRSMREVVALLVLAMPWSERLLDHLSVPSRILTAAIASPVIGALGLEVERSGAVLALPGLEVRVDGSCAGTTTLRWLLVVSVWLVVRSRSQSTSLPAIAGRVVACTLLANVLRVITITLVGSGWGIEMVSGMYHDMVGIVALGVAAWALLPGRESPEEGNR